MDKKTGERTSYIDFQLGLTRPVLAPHQYAQHYPRDIRDMDEDWIARRRAHLKLAAFQGPAAGIALSGGGVRSATLCLGVLQALAGRDKLKYFDFLSTVSGGGYIGACMSWLHHRLQRFPFGKQINDARGQGGRVLAWLRSRGKYLTPGAGIGVAALASALLGATFVNLFVILPVFLLLFSLLDSRLMFTDGLVAEIHRLPFFPNAVSQIWVDRAGETGYADWMTGFDAFLFLGWLGFIGFLTWTLFAAWLSRFPAVQDGLIRDGSRRFLGRVLAFACGMTLLGMPPLVYHLLADAVGEWTLASVMGSGAGGAASLLLGRWIGKGGEENRGVPAWAYRIGLALLAFAVFVLLYRAIHRNYPGGLLLAESWLWLWLLGAIVISYMADINHVSMHRYYRNRLMETYLSGKLLDAEAAGNDDMDASRFPMRLLHPDAGAPMHIINATASMVGSREPVLSQRGGTNFAFTPRYHGSQATGYRHTRGLTGKKPAGHSDITLATAMSISGAAVNPNNYFTRSRPLSFLMSLLNLRLGYWFPNPAGSNASHSWHSLMFRELFGYGLHENCDALQLSDGGHFENLGLYELVRRRCKFILVVDAGMDDNWEHVDLARCVELARVDFGVYIDIDISAMQPDDSGMSASPCAVGTIDYRGYAEPASDGEAATGEDRVGDTRVEQGTLLYVKSATFRPPLPELASYRKRNGAFPHESTADQFFDEEQFEVYRELGYVIGRIVRGEGNGEALPEIEQFWNAMMRDIGATPAPEPTVQKRGSTASDVEPA